jgi:hypothetical protein
VFLAFVVKLHVLDQPLMPPVFAAVTLQKYFVLFTSDDAMVIESAVSAESITRGDEKRESDVICKW